MATDYLNAGASDLPHEREHHRQFYRRWAQLMAGALGAGAEPECKWRM